MNYGSFYGGRRGASFVIVKNYPDIISMTNEFGRGPNFNEVEFDEYVIINTINKNHPDNGKIFRRGYDYNSGRKISGYRAFWEKDGVEYEIINGIPYDESGNEIEYDSDISIYLNARYQPDIDIDAKGAQYIGTIAGPSGRAPLVEMDTYNSVMQKSAEEGFQAQTSYGDYTLDNDSLMPGKYQENGVSKYNDKIQWFCTSLRNDKNDDSIAYIGFKTPYLVIDFLTESVSPYDGKGQHTDTSAAVRIQDSTTQNHPFYEKWKFSIPEGIKGDSLNNLRVITFNDPSLYDPISQVYTKIYTSQSYYYFYNREEGYFYGYSEQSGSMSETEGSISLIESQGMVTITPDTQIIVYDRFNYEDYENPTLPIKTYYLGVFNQIKQDGFIIDDYGNLRIDFTNDTFINKQHFIKVIRDIRFEEDPDDDNKLKMVIVFNTKENDDNFFDTMKFPIKMIKDVELNESGHLVFSFTDNTDFDTPFRVISNIEISQSALIITYNTKVNGRAETVSFPMSWVSDLGIKDDGQIFIKRNGFDTQYNLLDENNNLRILKWIDNVDYNRENGRMTITFNNGSYSTYDLRMITSIGFNQAANKLVVNYNTGDSNDIILTGKLISNISYENGKLGINYTGESKQELDITGLPTSVSLLNSNPNQDSILRIKHGDTTILESSPLTSIYDMVITSNHHLAVLFNDSKLCNDIKNSGKNLTYISSRDNKEYDCWLDLGSVFVDSGILIGSNFSYADLNLSAETASIDDVIDKLNENYYDYSNVDDFLKGRIFTIGDGNGKKEFYGFDYNRSIENPERYKGWYYLGSIENAAAALESSCRMGSLDEQAQQTQDIEIEGLYFLTEEWEE